MSSAWDQARESWLDGQVKVKGAWKGFRGPSTYGAFILIHGSNVYCRIHSERQRARGRCRSNVSSATILIAVFLTIL